MPAGVTTSWSYQHCAVQKSAVAKYGLAAVAAVVAAFAVRFCQPVYVAGNRCVAGSGAVMPAACDAARAAAGWSARSVRQKFAAHGLGAPVLRLMPSVRYIRV